jgi:phosphatidylserine/phosphatidylglycerophosphate/cardiolipin synthase-like enzyme
MSTRFVGRFVSTRLDDQGRRSPLIGFRVTLQGPKPLIGSGALGNAVITHVDGLVDFTYRRDPSQFGAHRRLELLVIDITGRRIAFDTADGREVMDDVEDERLGRSTDYVVRELDAFGLLATLGTGQTSIQSPNGFGWGFRAGNRVTTLMDVDAFRHAAELMRNAKKALAISQLFFSVPEIYEGDATQETTNLIFDFAGGPPDKEHPRAAGAGAGDARPERLLIDAGARGVDVRMLLNDVRIPLFIKIAAGAVAFPFAGIDGIFSALQWLDQHFTDADEVNRYFDQAGEPTVKAAAFEQPLLTTAGVMHAKLMVADWTHALSIGAPFGQSYVDSTDHEIDAPMRGGSTGFPKHDAAFAITGPAVAHLQETLKLMWDTVHPDDKLISFPGPTEPIGSAPTPPAPAVAAAPAPRDALAEDGVCGVQIVRTLTSGRFKDVPGIPEDGEKGILEAYQRAIGAAEDFVYIETQYFTNDAIGDAIVGAIQAKRNRPPLPDGTRQPDLQVILVCNIAPDVPFYPFKQRRLIHRIREAIGENLDEPKWFGVFTRWSHEASSPRPRMLPIYVHAKVAVVDNAWATVGSANLDGLSLDSMLLWDKLNAFLDTDLFRQQRAIEVNGCFLNSDGDSPVIDLMRRKLWAEQLGFSKARGQPDIDEPLLALAARPAGGWLSLWNQRAGAALRRAIDTPTQTFDGFARVLPWPKKNSTYKTPRKHLDALGIKTYKVVPLKSTRRFLFKDGVFDDKSKAEMDYD